MDKAERLLYLKGFDQIKPPHRLAATLRLIIQFFILGIAVTLAIAVLPSKAGSAEEEFDSVFDKASLNYRQGKYEEALKLYKKANDLKDNANPECLWGMAQTFNKLGAHKNTLQTCDRLIQVSGGDIGFLAKAWNLRGNTLSAAATEIPGRLDQTKLREAEAAYREVLKLSSSLNMAHYNLGVALIRLKRINEGLGELRVYVESADEEDVAEKARKIIENPRRAVEDFAPDFSIVTSEGEYQSSDELRGKVLLIDFWGVWCKPCLNAIPYLSQLAKKYSRDAFILISVDVNDEEAKWREFIAQNKMNWTHARDSNSKIQRSFQINAFPTYVLIDHEGIVRYRGKGAGLRTEGEISDAVKRALKAAAASPERPRPSPSESSPILSTEPTQTLRQDSTNIAPTLNASAADIAQPQAEIKKAYVLRIPKPVITLTVANPPNTVAGLKDQNNFYTLQLRNWASMPDELFTPSKDLQPCSTGFLPPTSSRSTRFEMIVWSEQGQVLRSFCNPPRPEVLQNLFLVIGNQVKPAKIYVTIKDRLTGYSVQSDLLALP